MKRGDDARIPNILRVLVTLAAAAVAAPAAAHSELQRSIPAAGEQLACAPQQIVLEFNEGVQLTALRRYRAGGDEIALPRRAIREASNATIDLPPLGPGEFRAEWRVISADGHPLGGVIPFSVAGDCLP